MVGVGGLNVKVIVVAAYVGEGAIVPAIKNAIITRSDLGRILLIGNMSSAPRNE